MNIVYFVLIVAVAAFCGGLAGSLVTYAAYKEKRKKRRPNVATKGKEAQHRGAKSTDHGHAAV